MQRKRDTSRGFTPEVVLSADLTVPSREALRLDGRLDEGTLSPDIRRLLLSMARLRNVVSSLRIERVDIDLQGARRVLESGRGYTVEESQVLRFAEEYGRIHALRPSAVPQLRTDLILDLHRRLMAGVVPDEELGRLKTEPNGLIDNTTGMFRFEATPPDRTAAELEALNEWFETQKDRLPPAVCAALFFAEFEAIHPFHDGNGRIGRILNLMVLKRLGLQNAALVPLDGRFYRTEGKYYSALASTNDGRSWHVWCRYYAKQLHRAYQIAVDRADLRPEIESHTQPSVRDVLQWVLGGDGAWFRHGDFPNPTGLGTAAISNAFRVLVERGVLESRGEKKGREYRLSTSYLKRIYGADLGA